MSLPTVFISYSHKDETEKEALLAHLGVLQGTGLLDLWNDDRIAVGADWEQEIDLAIKQARVAILLISANFLTSDFILNQEVPELLKRYEKENLTIFPIIAKACAWSRVGWLTRMNVRPKNGTPVWREGGKFVDEELALIADEVADIIDQARYASDLNLGYKTQQHDAERPGIAPSAHSPDKAYITNPYATRAMIKDPSLFVGRRAELHDLFNLLAAMQSCSIVGPRRIGKSSLLYYLTRPDIFKGYLPNPESYIFGFMDLQELASLEPDDFFYTAVEQFSRAGQGKLEVNLDRDGTRAGFRRFLMRTSDIGLHLILCCDEFEMLSQNTNFGPNFFTYLRGLSSNYNLALVTSSRASLFELCHLGNIQTSQFWNIFVERSLGLMPGAEAETLIREPFSRVNVKITDDDLTFVLNLAGRHPFFIQMACYHLFAAEMPRAYPAIEGRFFDEAKRHFAYAWKQLDDRERAILTTLSQAQQPIEPHLHTQLQRLALVAGKPEAPTLVSAGWRRYITDEIAQKSKSTPHVPQVAQNELATPPAEVSSEAELVYVDFEIKVEQLDASSCRVLVLDSPAGQDSVVCSLPFDLSSVGKIMVDLGQQITRGTTERAESHLTPTTVGEALFRSIFSGPVSQLFFESMGRVHSQGQGLRIKIHMDPEKSPELTALPWEFLYNDRRRHFLGLSRLTPIVRYLDVQAPTTPGQISLPLRVLVVIAAPNGLPSLDLSYEIALIEQAWGNRPDVSVEFLDPATPSALQAKLWDWQPQVLHFMGHGHFDPITGAGTLMFVDQNNEPKPIVGAQLGVLLSNISSIQLAFLNACQSAELSRSHELDPFSGVAAALVMAGLPAVVAMQFPISDEAALAFANGFYPRLASGESIERAVTFGREAVRLELNDNEEWGTPVLYMRVPDGQLFEISGAGPSPNLIV